MSKMAYQTPPETSVDMITQFGGYNHNISISDGEFYDMENLSSDKYPLATIRGKRVKLGKAYMNGNVQYDDIADVFYHGKYIIAENNGIYAIGLMSHSSGLTLNVFKYNPATNIWQFEGLVIGWVIANEDLAPTSYVNMGARICLFPTKVYYNTVTGCGNTIEYFEINRNTTTWGFGFTLAQANANAQTNTNRKKWVYIQDHNGNNLSFGTTGTSGPSEPSNPVNNQKWLDTSQDPPVFKCYSESSGTWNAIPLYARIEGYNEAWESAGERDKEADHNAISYFCVGDAIELENLAPAYIYTKNQKYWVISKAGHASSPAYNAWIQIPVNLTVAAGTQFAGSDDLIFFECTSLYSYRRMPAFDYITECNNRLWACRYGDEASEPLYQTGETVNEIFACKLGDPTNWHYFGNTAMDSYYLSLGAGGKFTGAMTYQSNPVFFKEDSIHRIYGNYPSNYQLKTVMGYGVKDGSDKSLTELNGNVFYLSNAGLTVYQGGTPANVSTIFGDEKYTEGIAASYGNKMYMTVKDSNNNRRVFVYDDRYDTWYQETGLPVKQMFAHNSKVFGVTDTDIYCLSEFNGLTSYESNVNWSFDTGKIGFASPLHKFINKITLRMRLALDAYASIYIQYDSDGNDTHVADIRPTGNVTTIAVPVIPHRCDHFNIRMQGAGKMELISLTKYYEETTDYD